MNKLVADVGLFNGTKNVSYNRESHQMLKVMMEEARMTNLQRKQINDATKNQGSFTPNKSSHKNKIGTKEGQQRDFKRGLKSYEQIKASDAYKVDPYIPLPITKYGGSYQKDKERLANIMAFGDVSTNRVRAPDKATKDKNVDRFEELQKEIIDRREFLDTMTTLGKAGDYRNKIETEISQMITEMEAIDRRRTAEDISRILTAESK